MGNQVHIVNFSVRLLRCGSVSCGLLPLPGIKGITVRASFGASFLFYGSLEKRKGIITHLFIYLQQCVCGGGLSLQIQNAHVHFLCINGIMWQMDSFWQVKSPPAGLTDQPASWISFSHGLFHRLATDWSLQTSIVLYYAVLLGHSAGLFLFLSEWSTMAVALILLAFIAASSAFHLLQQGTLWPFFVVLIYFFAL